MLGRSLQARLRGDARTSGNGAGSVAGGRSFAYAYRDVKPIPDGVKVLHVADNLEAFGREHPADVALLGDIGATLGRAGPALIEIAVK